MRRVPVLIAVTLAIAFAAYESSADGQAAGDGTRFFGHATLFDQDAPVDTHVRATIAGHPCGDALVELDANQDATYDIIIDGAAAACSTDGAEIEFLWYRTYPSIATTCTPTATFDAGADVPLDIICGVQGEFGAVWIVENTTDQVQSAVEVFPRVVLGGINVADAPGLCGSATPVAHTKDLFLRYHAEVIWPQPCVAPGETVRIGLSTDCPCQSELEIQRVVWLAGEPIFKANVDCDGDIDALDALRDLLIAVEAQVAEIDNCPSRSGGHYFSDALGGEWGDINCDRQITALDVVTILKVANQLPSGLNEDCQAEYYPAGVLG